MSLFKAESKSQRIERLMSENKQLGREIRILKAKLDKIQQDLDATPEDCKMGIYCKACKFAKYYHIIDRNGLYPVFTTINVCGKAEVCKNFVERKENNGS